MQKLLQEGTKEGFPYHVHIKAQLYPLSTCTYTHVDTHTYANVYTPMQMYTHPHKWHKPCTHNHFHPVNLIERSSKLGCLFTTLMWYYFLKEALDAT